MWLLWWPKSVSSTATGGKISTSSTSDAVSANSVAKNSSSASHCNCNCIFRLLRKLKKRGRVLCSTSGEPAFQCRYDPLSYSLNFDTSGCGSLLDEDYYQFCAFSSRFVSNPGNVSLPIPNVSVASSR